ncbi:MOSC domain-containing protein [Fictibacillus terranigra]|uniref:MOSC N-terminal beta barrel domain-containing protein n=1 Tax=Fictibacillus terranigra TaxID=3058424 RepID=A0ABT8EAS3_9BACL|nr:MOSC N-terminal beta barrel domain-containing protein [Fictibacillus sp. CENA-BCM004]MDN4074982.1 MOSC N-terminal beta barrel domain-containing protein [Fictibacillus sp. CENA-BCM004]
MLIGHIKEIVRHPVKSFYGESVKETKIMKYGLYGDRCMIITIHPENAERDSTLLKTVVQERNNHFGVYAAVIKTGELHNGDEVHLLE